MDSKTIKTQIVVQFDDQFTEAAIRSVEKYKKSLEEAQATKKEARGHLNTFFESEVFSYATHRLSLKTLPIHPVIL